MKEFWLYTLLRIGIFLVWLVTVIAVWALIAGSVPIMWAVVVAFALSGITSYFLLARQREALARRVEVRAQRMTRALDEHRAKEDVD